MLKTQNENGSNCCNLASCPEESTIGRFFEKSLEPAQMEAVALHIIECPRCRDAAADMAEWIAVGREIDVRTATSEERRVVCETYDSVRAKYVQTLWQEIYAAIQPRREYLAAADGQTADQVQQETAMRSGFIHFVSNTPPGHKDAWHAKWAVPTAVSDETCLRLQVFDGNERPIKCGTLIFCGVELAITDGYAFISIKSFRKNIGKSLIALKMSDGRLIEGEPVKAYEGA